MSSISSLTSSNDSPIFSEADGGFRIGGGGRVVARKPSHKKQIPLPSLTTNEKEAESQATSEVVVTGVKPSNTETKWWITANIDDVEATPNANTCLKTINKKKKAKLPTPEDLTRLVSIAGISPPDLLRDDLRRFGANIGIAKANYMNKKQLCEAIAEVGLNPSLQNQVKSRKPNVVNRKRYINVIFSDDIRELLATRGESLTANDMTEGVKKDEMLHRSIATAYNDSEKHNEDPHTSLRNCKGASPSKFAGPIEWTQSPNVLSTLVREYEIAFNNWKLSGNHGGFGDNSDNKERIPFINFVKNNNILLYLHEYVYQWPDIFAKVTGQLPGDAFSESINPNDDDHSSSATSGKKKSKSSSSRRSNRNDEAWDEFNRTNKKKQQDLRYGILIESSNTLDKSISDNRTLKRQRLSDAVEESTTTKGLKLMKNRFKKYKQKVENKQSNKSNLHSDLDSDVEDPLLTQESQESVFNEVLEIERRIDMKKKQLDLIQEELNEMSKSKENTALEALIL